MEKFKRSLGSFAVPLLSILLAFLIGGIIMAALGADPFQAVKYLFQGAFGSRANIGTTLTAWILSLAGIESDTVWLRLLKPESFSPVVAFIGIMLIIVIAVRQ